MKAINDAGQTVGEGQVSDDQSEGYPKGWLHAKIHLNPDTGEMHSDGDHRVRTWIQGRIANTTILESQLQEEQMQRRDAEREERRYRDRRERFALAIFRTLASDVSVGKLLTDDPDTLASHRAGWSKLARQAVAAADALEEALNPSPPDLPQHMEVKNVQA